MSESKVIPVVFATDDGYAPYLGVALHSLIAHTNVERKYQIYILYTKLNKEHRRRLIGMSTAHVAVECVDITEQTAEFSNYTGITHLSVETTYRLLIPDLFPQYDKILYLDCDIVVLDDVASLYALDLGDNVLGVAELAVPKIMESHFREILNIDVQEGFNAGILLFNNKKMKDENIKDKCMGLLQEEWKQEQKRFLYQDQDVLNITCEGMTFKFPMNWNLEWQYQLDTDDSLEDTLEVSLREKYDRMKAEVKILHYASQRKPWDRPDYPYADLFWKYARETVFYEEILMNVTVRRKVKFNTFPWRAIEAGSVIVLYGFGDVGQSYLEQMVMTNYCHVCAICDQNASNISDNLIPVVTKEEISEFQFDYIVVAVQDEAVKRKIKDDLLGLGIDEGKMK